MDVNVNVRSQPSAKALRRRALRAMREEARQNATPIAHCVDRLNVQKGDINEAKINIRVFLKLTGQREMDRIQDSRTLYFDRTNPPLARLVVNQYANYYHRFEKASMEWEYVLVAFAIFDYDRWDDAPVDLDKPLQENAPYAMTIFSPNYQFADSERLPMHNIALVRQ
uniref:Neur_chan_LBD domain-containing protein n=1 Tax=Steinernema glaseri TaxID=37863 RepID=A0A1I8ADQ0_9BILA